MCFTRQAVVTELGLRAACGGCGGHPGDHRDCQPAGEGRRHYLGVDGVRASRQPARPPTHAHTSLQSLALCEHCYFAFEGEVPLHDVAHLASAPGTSCCASRCWTACWWRATASSNRAAPCSPAMRGCIWRPCAAHTHTSVRQSSRCVIPREGFPALTKLSVAVRHCLGSQAHARTEEAGVGMPRARQHGYAKLLPAGAERDGGLGGVHSGHAAVLRC